MIILCIALISVSSVLSRKKVYDLTYEINDKVVYWPEFNNDKLRFKFTDVALANRSVALVDYVLNKKLCTVEHVGTHMDAPIHFARGKKAVSEIDIEEFIGPAFIVDVEAEAKNNSDLLIDVFHIKREEKKQGRIPDGSIILINTGWSKKWPNATAFLGTNTSNTSLLHYPGMHPHASKWLVNNRKIKALGMDTVSIDYGQSKRFRSHIILNQANIPLFENVKDVHLLVGKKVQIYALPMKIKDGSGAPMRMIAVEMESTWESSGGYFTLSFGIMFSCLIVTLYLL